MKAFETLTRDHERIRVLFETVEDTDDEIEKKRLFRQVREAVDQHMVLERSCIYPALVSFEELRGAVSRARAEQGEIEAVLSELEGLLGKEGFDDRFEDLIDSVESHIEDLEGTVFPVAMRSLSREELDRIEDAVAAARLRSAA